ncbi:NitT/TauT family transport system permease protein [Motilibacter rhizosphaerae]|uniref:NitT/TauT family transport system permease protein n=1 Tax=Motilibacter rhizosphaerae TaxID=598652 RepID=A0A4Q7NSW6_9ACTN|nr:ABC transporter permease [Motilibacter rhizosphaerae]RZS89472.1 NitT/TauT family transport system permease protein [Motilibacter rhizosphaerae]
MSADETVVGVDDSRVAAAALLGEARQSSEKSLEAGLDALATETEDRAPWWRRALRSALPPVVVLVGLFVAWDLWTLVFRPSSTIFPGPADVGATFRDHWSDGTITEAFRGSLGRAALGFALSLVVGTVLGVLVAQVRFIRAGFGPLLSGLQVLPSVAWVPPALIWFGASQKAMLAVVLLGAVPSIANGLVAGVDQVPPLYLRVGRVLGARGLKQVWHVVLPAALPGYLAGLKQGWAFSWRSLMAAELIVRSSDIPLGLGQFEESARDLNDLPWVFLGIFLILVVGIVVELACFAPLERTVLRRRGLLLGKA